MPRLKDTRRKVQFRVLGALVTVLAGLALLLPAEPFFERISFDLPFDWRSNLEVTNAVLVYFNQSCLNTLFETNGVLKPEAFSPPLRTNMPPDRRIYVGLLRTMKQAGARLVFFDCRFDQSRPGEDEQFAEAIRENGAVFLGGVYDATSLRRTGAEAGVEAKTILPPNATLLGAVKDCWGLLEVNEGPGHRVRQMFTMDKQRNAAVFLAAQFSGFKARADTTRWINYYGPAGSIDSVLLPEALKPKDPSRFRDRAVFIGGGTEAADLHFTPYSRKPTTGVEILATSYLNLVQRNWLERWNTSWQAAFIIAWGLFANVVFLAFRPRLVLLSAPFVALLPLLIGFYTQWEMNRWWSWAVCSFAQTPLAAAWAMIANRWLPWPPVVFISYRRLEGEGSGYAQAIFSALEHRGYGAICDVKAELTTQPFRPQLNKLIESVPNFVLILSQNSLNAERIKNEDDVLRGEIRHALGTSRNIMSVMIGDFRMPSASQLPPDLRKLPEQNAFVRRDENPWLVVDQLCSNIRRPSISNRLRWVLSGLLSTIRSHSG